MARLNGDTWRDEGTHFHRLPDDQWLSKDLLRQIRDEAGSEEDYDIALNEKASEHDREAALNRLLAAYVRSIA